MNNKCIKIFEWTTTGHENFNIITKLSLKIGKNQETSH